MSRRLLPLMAGGLLLALVATAAPDAPLAAQSEAAAKPQAPALPVALKPLFEGITLSDRQLQQVADVHNKHGGAIGKVMADAPTDSSKAGMGAGATDHRVEEAKDLRGVLTPDQQRIFDRNLEKVKADWKKPAGY